MGKHQVGVHCYTLFKESGESILNTGNQWQDRERVFLGIMGSDLAPYYISYFISKAPC